MVSCKFLTSIYPTLKDSEFESHLYHSPLWRISRIENDDALSIGGEFSLFSVSIEFGKLMYVADSMFFTFSYAVL